MPRKAATRECQYCHQPKDTRGIRMHEAVCSENPANMSKKGPHSEGKLDRDRLNGNFREVVKYAYEQGIEIGVQIGKKIA